MRSSNCPHVKINNNNNNNQMLTITVCHGNCMSAVQTKMVYLCSN